MFCKISRSPAAIIAYVMTISGLPFQTCYEFVLARRIVVRPNDGFIEQLKTFEKEQVYTFEKLSRLYPGKPFG